MIQVENLVKWYGPNLAVDHLNFTIPVGQVVGFLGPNGAGKTTTLRMLTGYLPPTSGKAIIDGHDVLTDSDAARARIGYLPESTPLYPEMRVEEFLWFRGKLLKMPRAAIRKRIDVVVDRCGLSLVRRRVIGHLSKGNKQRVGVAQALLHDPPVLILDEPTAGLDPNQISHFRKLIGELRGQRTILLSTHILPEVEKTADRVLIIAGGRIVAQGKPDELRQRVRFGARLRVEVKAGAEEVKRVLSPVEGVERVDTEMNDGWCTAVLTPKPGRDLREAAGKAMMPTRWHLREMRPETATLEQFFIQITAEQSQAVAEERRA